jgi:hypothetical protein
MKSDVMDVYMLTRLASRYCLNVLIHVRISTGTFPTSKLHLVM